MAGLSQNKSRIAKRVVEVIDFFNEERRDCSVMDICRHYGRPQSSTSELLGCLVNLGVLHRDRETRRYCLTPRLALLGNRAQPALVRSGRLSVLLGKLSAQMGCCVTLFGRVGLKAQVFDTRAGRMRQVDHQQLNNGQSEHLSDTVVGWLLLSTLPDSQLSGTLRRLNAEAEASRKFCVAEVETHVAQCRYDRCGVGPSGFGLAQTFTAALVPQGIYNQPLVIGFAHRGVYRIRPEGLVRLVEDAIADNEQIRLTANAISLVGAA